MTLRRVDVDLPRSGYEVCVGRGALSRMARSVRSLCGQAASRAFLVVDTGVPERFGAQLSEDLQSEGFTVCSGAVTPRESIKSLETFAGLLTQLAGSGQTRIDPVIALGGGVVGDIAGFVAACYQRGAPVFQCPTTLLSMVDASVGGKTGVNLSVPSADGDAVLHKNLVGAFHQPKMVCADIDTLESLDARQRRCGLAECVKHAMIAGSVGADEPEDEPLLDWTVSNLDAIRAFRWKTIEQLVARNVTLKARVVLRDVEESPEGKAGGRMLLNFGHTFGHAIETLHGLSPDPDDPALAPLHHGEAVALGMVAACAAAEIAGLCEPAVGEELRLMLREIGLPTTVHGLASSETIVERMTHDKKSAGGELRVILPVGRGRCAIFRNPERAQLKAGIDAIRG